jgi:hypothetical protein
MPKPNLRLPQWAKKALEQHREEGGGNLQLVRAGHTLQVTYNGAVYFDGRLVSGSSSEGPKSIEHTKLPRWARQTINKNPGSFRLGSVQQQNGADVLYRSGGWKKPWLFNGREVVGG